MEDAAVGLVDANTSDLEAWLQYAAAREGFIEMATMIFKTQTIFDNFDDMYTVTCPDFANAPIQALASAQQLRLQFLKRWRNRTFGRS